MSTTTLPAHSEIGASSYSRWSTTHGGCPGSVKMSEGCPNIESEYAKEGTQAHLCASEQLEYMIFGIAPKSAEPGVPLIGAYERATDEMKAAVDVYTEYCCDLVDRAEPDFEAGHILIESRLDLTEVHEGLFGTGDFICYWPKAKKLSVVDYKHGAGIAVEVEDSLQLQYYGLGALLKMKLPVETVELTIVQPRCDHEDGPIRTWTFKAVEILDFAADLAFDAAAVFKPNAPLNVGKHCRFCPAAPTKCPAIKNKAQSLAKLEFSSELSYDPVKLDESLKMLTAIEGWVTKVREFAYAEATAGRCPPNWKLVAKRATRKWVKPQEEIVKYMVDATKKDPKEFFTEPDLKSPAQMEKLCNKQVGEGLRVMMESVSSGFNLAPLDDPRPAAKLDPKTEFTKIEGNT